MNHEVKLLKKILLIALLNIERRIKNFIKIINTTKFESDNNLEGKIEIQNEDHTLGNLITRGMQQHSEVEFAGYNLPHPLIEKVIFHYKIKNTKKVNIKTILNDVVDYYIELIKN